MQMTYTKGRKKKRREKEREHGQGETSTWVLNEGEAKKRMKAYRYGPSGESPRSRVKVSLEILNNKKEKKKKLGGGDAASSRDGRPPVLGVATRQFSRDRPARQF